MKKSSLASLVFLAVVLAVIAGCGGGGGSTLFPLPGSAPAAPENLTVNAGNGQITAVWAPSAGATSYAVYYSTSSMISKSTGTRLADVTSPKTIASLSNGTKYYVMVTASNSNGESAGSLVRSATPTATPAPAAPLNVQAAAGSGSAIVTWDASAGATSYNVYYSSASPVSQLTGTQVAGASSPATIAGLTNGTTYYFVVTAVNANGESSDSFQVFATPQAPAQLPPAAPTNVSANPGDGKITVSWTASTGATGYNIYYGTATGVTKTNGTKVAAGSGTTYDVTGLQNGIQYFLVVTAVNANGESAESGEVNATPVAPAGTNLRVTVVNNSFSVSGISGATVVLGDSTGAMITSAQTDSNGVVNFTNPPQDATVTAATFTDGGGTGSPQYYLNTDYNVNVPAITLSFSGQLGAPSALPTKLGSVAFNVSCNGATSVVMYASNLSWQTPVTCSGGSATATLDVYPSDQQSDGNYSFLGIGLDANGQPVSYGTLLDQAFINNMPVNITLNQTLTTVGVTFSNIPATSLAWDYVFSSLMRKDGLMVSNGTMTSLNPVVSSTTVTFGAPASFGTFFEASGDIFIDTNNSGVPDTYFFFDQMSPSFLSSVAMDINTFPQAPSSVNVMNAATDRPTIAFSGANWIGLYTAVSSGPTTSQYNYAISMPDTTTSIVFPELPSSLAAFRPGAWNGSFNFQVEEDQTNVCTSYSDCLTKQDEYYAGTFSPPANELDQDTGVDYVVNSSGVLIQTVVSSPMPGVSSAPIKALPPTLHKRFMR